MRLGLAACLYLLLTAKCCAGDAVTLYYNERPPYLVTAPDGSVTGLTATPAGQAFAAAGIAAAWLKMPINRQLALLTQEGRHCAVGWFRNASREQLFRFSRPIYRDLPTVALVRRDFPAPDNQPLAELLATPGVRILVKENYSYGQYIDELLLRHRAALAATSAESGNMIAMINIGRADLMFVAEEEARHLIGQSGLEQKNFRMVHFAGMPPGELRHIMCGKDVPEEWMRRLDRQIPALAAPGLP